jgi:hypothetical protein
MKYVSSIDKFVEEIYSSMQNYCQTFTEERFQLNWNQEQNPDTSTYTQLLYLNRILITPFGKQSMSSPRRKWNYIIKVNIEGTGFVRIKLNCHVLVTRQEVWIGN